jgi:acetylornithine/N-succinyldiaminopimelate aminotransferase
MEITNRPPVVFMEGRGSWLKDLLEALSQKYDFGEVRGRGLLLALNLKREIGPKVVDLARGKGLLLNAPRPDTLRFMPALTLTGEEVDQMIGILSCILPEGCVTRYLMVICDGS